MSEVDAYLEEQIQRIEQQTIYNLSYVGERCLNEAVRPTPTKTKRETSEVLSAT